MLLDVHRDALAAFDRLVLVAGARSAWPAPTPCAAWSVRELVNHLVAEQLWVPHLLSGAELSAVGDRYDGDVLGADPVAAWSAASAAARAAWCAPGALDRTVALSIGPSSAADYGWEMTADLALHGWDLAAALGEPQPIAEHVAAPLLDTITQQLDRYRVFDMFATPLPVADPATAAERLLAASGRDPSWTPPG